jgi:hypothetical protein
MNSGFSLDHLVGAGEQQGRRGRGVALATTFRLYPAFTVSWQGDVRRLDFELLR